jgi:hypothetical protein
VEFDRRVCARCELSAITTIARLAQTRLYGSELGFAEAVTRDPYYIKIHPTINRVCYATTAATLSCGLGRAFVNDY